MPKSQNRANKPCIIACAVFEPIIKHLRLQDRYPALRVTYLPANLHLKPQELRNLLQKKVASAQKMGERIICLYGNCFPDICSFCKTHGIDKVPGHYCYEMLLGTDRFTQLIDEMAGTYFLERGLIQDFKACCMDPLELDDDEIRKSCFEHYRRLLYVRQPSDPDLQPKIDEVAGLLELPLEIRDADYSHLEKLLVDLIEDN